MSGASEARSNEPDVPYVTRQPFELSAELAARVEDHLDEEWLAG